MLLAATIPLLVVGSIMGAGPAKAVDPTQAQQLVAAADLSAQQWGYRAVGGTAAANASRGEGVIVAVVDTGVDGTHPDLAGRVLPGMDFTSTVPRELPAGINSDLAGHGTHVAGVIAAADDRAGITGIAPDAQILPVRVIGPDVPKAISIKAIPKGILWAAANGAAVINLSIGGSVADLSDATRTAICDAVAVAARTAVVIASSGNERESGNPQNVPASCPGALSVTSVGPDLRTSYFSSFDATAGISAPGTDILSTAPFEVSRSGYEEWSGTSMAAPHVSGAAALAVAAHQGMPSSQIADLIRANAVDLGPEGPDPVYGAGLLDAAAVAGGASQASGEQFHLHATAGAMHGSLVQLSWVPPGSAAVDRYEVSALGSDQTATVVSGGDVRTTFDVSSLGGASTVIVTAVTRSGLKIPSAPLVLATPAAVTDTRADAPVLKGFSARWVRDGLLVTWKLAAGHGLIHIDALSDSGVPVQAKTGRILLAAPAGASARSSRLLAVAYAGDTDLARTVAEPQYGVRFDVSLAGDHHMILVGGVSCKSACGGRTVVFSTSSGEVLGTGVANESGWFAVTVPVTRNNFRAEAGPVRSNWTNANDATPLL